MRLPSFSRPRAARGFTLIELMIVVAIVGILVRVAYPAYMQSVKKSRRADAKTALLDLAQREERYMATANIYTTSAPALGYPNGSTITIASPMNVMTGTAAYYTLQVDVQAATPTAFTAKALRTGSQVADTQCGDYTLTNTGAQSVSGTGNASDCW
jgi:type IV pilus assembly protein PilE